MTLFSVPFLNPKLSTLSDSSAGSMKDVIDVMQLQQTKGREFPPVKYKDRINHFSGSRFIFECGL